VGSRPRRDPAGAFRAGSMTVFGVQAGARRIALPVRGLAVLAVVAIAYNYSLSTLLRGLSLQTPLAYLALVPVIAVLLAWVRLAREPVGRPIHDRQLDYIVGIGFILLAVGVSVLVSLTLTTRFWLYRIDLLSLPLFASGIVALLYGVRRLWTLKFPLAFLFLAWPLPYAPLVGDGMALFTQATATALYALAHVLPVAIGTGGEDAVFFVRHGASTFPLSIGAACAGVNSLVGFLLVGGAISYVVRGSLGRRVLWLLAGLAVVWILNVLRIELIFIVGWAFGKQIALDVLHPVAGLVIFNIGVFAMLAAVPRFGLGFVSLQARESSSVQQPSPVRRIRASLAVALAIALGLGVLNASFSRFEQIASPLGQALLTPFDIRTAQLADWESGFVASNEAGKQFFGENSTWDRIQYASLPTARLRASLPVYIDVITTDDPGAFAEYGLEACYTFHNYRIESTTTADIGAGVQGQVLDYHDPRLKADWSAIWWEWPYQENGATRFERIIIFLASGPRGEYAGGATDIPAARAPRFTDTDRFLVAMARDLVSSQLGASRS
jgi:exosortase